MQRFLLINMYLQSSLFLINYIDNCPKNAGDRDLYCLRETITPVIGNFLKTSIIYVQLRNEERFVFVILVSGYMRAVD